MATKDTKILELELRIYESKVKIKDLKESLKTLDGRFNSTKLKAKQLEVEEQKLIQRQAQLIQSNKQLELSSKNLIGGADKGLQGVSQASGAASATTLELGRVISDMPYGIRGVANNLSQVASQMAFMSRATDAATGRVVGLGGAFKALWGSIMGPLGILLVIQAAIAALDYFGGSNRKAKEEVEGLTDALEEQLNLLNLLEEAMTTYQDIDWSTPKNARESYRLIEKQVLGWVDALKILRSESSEFNRKYESLTDIQKQDAKQIETLVNKYIELIQTKKKIADVNNKIKKAKEDGVESIELNKELQLLLLKKANLKEIFEVDKESGKSIVNRLKSFKSAIFDLEKEILKFKERALINLDEYEAEKIERTQETEIKLLDIQLQSFKDRQQIRLDEFLARGLSDEENEAARKAKEQADKAAETEHARAISAIRLAHNTESLNMIVKFNREAALLKEQAWEIEK